MAADGKFQRNHSKSSKLTASQVQDIRALYARGDCTQGTLARDFQVSVIQIGRIVRGEVWQHLPALAPSERQLEESARRLWGLQQAADSGMNKLQEVAKEELRGQILMEEIQGASDAGYEEE